MSDINDHLLGVAGAAVTSRDPASVYAIGALGFDDGVVYVPIGRPAGVHGEHGRPVCTVVLTDAEAATLAERINAGLARRGDGDGGDGPGDDDGPAPIPFAVTCRAAHGDGRGKEFRTFGGAGSVDAGPSEAAQAASNILLGVMDEAGKWLHRSLPEDVPCGLIEVTAIVRVGDKQFKRTISMTGVDAARTVGPVLASSILRVLTESLRSLIDEPVPRSGNR